MLSDEEIRDSVAADEKKDAQTLCENLVALANDKGGVDNITVVFVRIPDPANNRTEDAASKEKASGGSAR